MLCSSESLGPRGTSHTHRPRPATPFAPLRVLETFYIMLYSQNSTVTAIARHAGHDHSHLRHMPRTTGIRQFSTTLAVNIEKDEDLTVSIPASYPIVC